MKNLTTLTLGSLLLISIADAQDVSAPEEVTAQMPQDFIAQALENNLGLEVSRLDVGINEDNVQSEWGQFSPVLGFEIGVDELYRQQNAREILSSNLSGEYEEEVSYGRATLGGRLPFGTSYEFAVNSSRTRSSYTERSSSFYDPEYGSNVNLTVTQPLLKNFGLDVNLAPVNLAKAELEVAELETQALIESVMGRVLLSCFETYFAEENVKVKKESIRLAETLRDENRKRVEQGRMSPIDVTQAEARLAEAEAELLEAQTFLKQRQTRLRELTQENYDFDAAEIEVKTVDGVLPAIPAEFVPSDLAGLMLTHNQDYLAALKQAQAEGIRVLYNKNQVYPEINLRLSLGTSGLSDGFGDSFEDFEERTNPDWGVGLAFSMPLDNRTAKSRYRASQKRERQALMEAKEVEIQLLSALDNAITQLKAGLERRELIGESVRLAEEALEAEEKRLINGVTTNFDVLNQQRLLSVSLTQGLAAEVEVQKAWIQLLLIQGRLSESLGYTTNYTIAGPNS